MQRNKFIEKLSESLKAVLPIVLIVLLLSFSIAPIPNSILLSFIFGSILLIIGQVLFSLGAEISMEQMGNLLGISLTKTKKLPLILIIGFILGFVITISEPDLQVLANQVQAIPNDILIYFVAIGVGVFLALSLTRTFLGFPLKYTLIIFYILLFILSIFVPKDFLTVAFDSGGVTTGPMTVPFIMSFGIGISALRTDKKASNDSFGSIALCSVGPILAVMILSIVYSPKDASYSPVVIPNISHSLELAKLFTNAIPIYLKEITKALLPIVCFFLIYQFIALKLSKGTMGRIIVGLVYTFLGLILFLTGVNVGFLPAGSFLGETLSKLPENYIIIPLGMLMGYFIVKAEPAVSVLEREVEDITEGLIPGKTLQSALSIGVAVSVGISMIRVLTGISIMYFLIIGYLIAIVFALITPDIFVGIAFDSGGVASGPMTASFLLPFAQGACIGLGGNVSTDAFGVVAMVAMTPIITIEALGIIYKIKNRKNGTANEAKLKPSAYEIIEL